MMHREYTRLLHSTGIRIHMNPIVNENYRENLPLSKEDVQLVVIAKLVQEEVKTEFALSMMRTVMPIVWRRMVL
jgi:hypothetical protein